MYILPGHLGPPVVEPADEGDDGAADHHVVEVRDDEVGVVQVQVDAEHPEEEAGEAADREEEEERQRVQHRRAVPDGAARTASRSS